MCHYIVIMMASPIAASPAHTCPLPLCLHAPLPPLASFPRRACLWRPVSPLSVPYAHLRSPPRLHDAPSAPKASHMSPPPLSLSWSPSVSSAHKCRMISLKIQNDPTHKLSFTTNLSVAPFALRFLVSFLYLSSGKDVARSDISSWVTHNSLLSPHTKISFPLTDDSLRCPNMKE